MLISIIVPCRNESGFIDHFVKNVLDQQIPLEDEIEVVIADGGSDDGTRESLDALAARDDRLVILDNPSQIVSAGLNLAIHRSRGEVVIRLDVHTEYAPDYLAQCCAALLDSGADNVGGPWVARGAGNVGAAIAQVFSNRWVSGGGRSHDPNYEGYLDSVYLGCWRRETLDELGGFDDSLVRGQDSELNFRIVLAGGKVWQTPKIRSWYRPRSSVRDLFRQYVQYGYWKVAALKKHGRTASLRQLMPAVFVGVLAVLAPIGLIWPPALTALAASLLWYTAVSLAIGCKTCLESGRPRLIPLMPAVIAAFHFGFGLGYLRGLLDFLLVGRPPSAPLVALTRSPESVKSK